MPPEPAAPEVVVPLEGAPTAVIAGTNGDGARCRTTPDYSGDVIAVLGEGEIVSLNGDAIGEWQPIVCAGAAGYVHVDFILLDGEVPAEPVATEPPVEVTEEVVEPQPTEAAPVETEVAEEPVATEETTDPVITDPEVTEPPAEEVTEPATEEVTEPEATEPPTEEATEPEATEPEATEPPTEEANEPPSEEPTEAATEETTEPAATEPATPEATETAEAETPEATEEVAATPEPTEAPAPTIEASQEDLTAAAETLTTSATTGSAFVSGTNGAGVRCRAKASFDGAVITVIAEGTDVALRGSASGSWQPVTCAGKQGFIFTDYLVSNGDATGGVGADFTAAAETGTAKVSGTNGGGLRCRSSASFDGSIITVLSEGATVSLRGSAQGDWQPVTCAGMNGFVHTDYITTSSGGSTSGGSTSGGSSSSGSATVTGTNGDGVRCRSGAGFDASIITVVAEGTTVTLRGSAQGDWQPVTCASRNGFIHSDYLTAGGSSSGGSNNGGSSGGSSSGGSTTGSATVSGTNGDGVRCRSSASFDASIITVVAEGTKVSLRGSAQGVWQPVVCAGTNGFIHSDYLTAGGSSSGGSNNGGSSGGSSSGGMSAGDHAPTTANLNLRYEPSLSAGVAAVAPSGTVVKITGQRSGFYAVDWDGLEGWMSADYLTPTNAALSQRGGSGTNNGGNNGGTSGGSNNSGGGTATGNAIVDFAMQYVGYPYVWAGEGPYGFDCSGFTMFVIRNVLGMNITHDMFVQYDLGTKVSWGAWQPGDLVFFQNTFQWGLSHVGIYIGGGQFVHAENETTGVRVSDINSQYYSSRYYGAVRFT